MSLADEIFPIGKFLFCMLAPYKKIFPFGNNNMKTGFVKKNIPFRECGFHKVLEGVKLLTEPREVD